MRKPGKPQKSGLSERFQALTAASLAANSPDEKVRRLTPWLTVQALSGLVEGAVAAGVSLEDMASVLALDMGIPVSRAKKLLAKYYRDGDGNDGANEAKRESLDKPSGPAPAGKATPSAPPPPEEETPFQQKKRELLEKQAALKAAKPSSPKPESAGPLVGDVTSHAPGQGILAPGEPMPPTPTDYEVIEKVVEGKPVKLYRLPNGKLFSVLPGIEADAPYGRNEDGVTYSRLGGLTHSMIGKGFIGVDI